MNRCLRTLISLTTVLPLSITFTYLYAGVLFEKFPVWLRFDFLSVENVRVILTVLVASLNHFLGALILLFLKYFTRKAGERVIKVTSVKELGGDALMSYMPYVLPLFIIQGESQEMMGWFVGFCLLFCLSWSSMTISFSPLLRLCGLRFYEAVLVDGKIVILLIGDENVRPLWVKSAVTISDSCLYGVG